MLSFSNVSSTNITIRTFWTKPFLSFELTDVTSLEFLDALVVEDVWALFASEVLIHISNKVFTMSANNLLHLLLIHHFRDDLILISFLDVTCWDLDLCKVLIFFLFKIYFFILWICLVIHLLIGPFILWGWRLIFKHLRIDHIASSFSCLSLLTNLLDKSISSPFFVFFLSLVFTVKIIDIFNILIEIFEECFSFFSNRLI